MKLNRTGFILRITAYVCVALFTVCVLIYGFKTDFGFEDLAKESEENTFDVMYTYEEEVKYLREVEVDWVNGPVTMHPYAGEIIKVTEASGEVLQEDEKLYLEISGGTLSVRWNNAWLQLGLQRQHAKQLEILIPQNFYDTLEEVRVKTVSGNIEMEALALREAEFISSSGELHLKDITAERLTAETVSGNLVFQNIAGTEEMAVSTNSGNITLAGTATGAAELSTTSGAVTLSGDVQTLMCDTVSGDVQMDLTKWPEKITLHSVSANADILVPATEDGFLCRFTSVSGEFLSDFSMKKTGDTYTCGKGTYSVRIDTTSGDVSLNQKVG